MAIVRSNWTFWLPATSPSVNPWYGWRAWDNWPQWPSNVPWTTAPQNTTVQNSNTVSVPTFSIAPMSTSDILNARYQAAYNAGNTDLANAYSALNQGNSSYNKIANQITSYYDALAKDVAKREQWLANAKYNVANKLFNDMADQKDYVYGLYGPNGTFTREINTYYDDMGDYLASEAGREMAYADALGVQSGASLWMMRAQRNKAYNEAFQRSLQVMQQELEAKQSIQQNLINFMTALRQEYWDTANTYIISQYQRANDLLNAISENIASTSSQIATSRLSWGWRGGWQQQQQGWWEITLDDFAVWAKKNWIKADDPRYSQFNKDWSFTISLWSWDTKTFWSWTFNSWWWINKLNTYLWTWYVPAWTWAGTWTWS